MKISFSRSCGTLLRRGVLLAVLLLHACAAPQLPTYPGNDAAGSGPEPYRIEPGDVIAVSFPSAPDWDTVLKVRSDGRITVPVVGELEASGLYLAELDEAITAALTPRLRVPADVELDVVSLRDRAVFVGGEVVEPGTVRFASDRITLLEACVAAGGPVRRTAELSRVVLVRLDREQQRHLWSVDLGDMLASAQPAGPVYLLPGDVVLVPPQNVVKVNDWVENYITRMIPGGIIGLVAIGL